MGGKDIMRTGLRLTYEESDASPTKGIRKDDVPKGQTKPLVFSALLSIRRNWNLFICLSIQPASSSPSTYLPINRSILLSIHPPLGLLLAIWIYKYYSLFVDLSLDLSWFAYLLNDLYEFIKNIILIHIYHYHSLSMSIDLSIHLSVYLFVYRSISMLFDASIHLIISLIHPPRHPRTYSRTCPSSIIRSSICPPIHPLSLRPIK